MRARRIGLLFNANKIFDREVMEGVAAHSAQLAEPWNLFLEQDFQKRLESFRDWHGDGIIADYGDPAVAAALKDNKLPVVALGGSFRNDADYPPGVPYVATDNAKLVKLAIDHLIDAGLPHLALFSLPAAPEHRWAQEREDAFRELAGPECIVYRGQSTSAASWGETGEQQIAWLRGLPKPVGIIAVNDARARQLMQACSLAGIAVPEQVALIGIDNDPLAGMLSRVPLSSVIQGTHEIGRTAAHLLDQMIQGAQLGGTRILVPPSGINVLASTRHEPGVHPYVSRARHFIRQYACQGIRTSQVADYVGVSQTTLAMCFRRHLGRSVHEEILRCRLLAATARLGSGATRLADVAQECGFRSNQYLHTVFRRELGCSPHQVAQPAHHLEETSCDAEPHVLR